MNARTTYLLALLPFLLACTSATIKSETAKGYDFTPLTSYYWISPERAGMKEMSPSARQLSKGISKVVGAELERRGYRLDDRNPDFLVVVAAETRRGKRVNTVEGGSMRNSYGSWGKVKIRGQDFNYEEGAIMVWAFDAKTGDHIWNAWARDAIKESEPPTEEGVAQVVSDLMVRFPGTAPTAAAKKTGTEQPAKE